MRAVFLGTNGWYSTALGNTSCILLDSQKYYVILDAGDGLYKLDQYIRSEKPIVLFLSHLHLDHIIGFHVLNKFRFSQKIEIYGYVGTKRGLAIINHPYTAPLSELPSKISTYEINEGKHRQPFPFTCKRLVHADYCLGYRLELDGKIIAYCTDTGVCKNIYELSENADLLITECSLKTGEVSGEWREEWPHLRPEDAAHIASEARVGRLALTHFDASKYLLRVDRKYAEAVARKIFAETYAVFDGVELQI